MKKGKNLIFLLVVIVVGFVFFHSNVNAEKQKYIQTVEHL